MGELLKRGCGEEKQFPPRQRSIPGAGVSSTNGRHDGPCEKTQGDENGAARSD